ncbi:MAG: NAD-dependent protein deacetylase [Sandaracinaceae bacterium]
MLASIPASPVRDDDVERLAELLRERNVAVLTGAGCSTESGIPDYRGPETRRRARNPVKYRQFMRDPEARRRYWARAVVGWGRFAGKHPNAAHRALAALERSGHLRGLITQNVDRLHHAAGSRDVIELHGALAEVRCMGCDGIVSREELQSRLLAANPGWTSLHAEMAPDGDAELPPAVSARFELIDCDCGGFFKPNVVFFGESVPRPLVERAYAEVDAARVLLVIGSSLAVFSGYRFVKRAAQEGRPVALVNLGESRGDPHATLNVQARAGEVLPRVAEALGVLTHP